jgi:PAS domain S-box-containing protein
VLNVSSYEVIITIDSKGLILFCNDSIQDIFGYSTSEILGKSITMLMPEKIRELHLNGLKRVKSNKNYKTGINSALGLKKDGTEFEIEISISTWKSGKDTYFASVIQDTKKRKQAERSLKESEQKYRKIFENFRDIYYQIEINGKIIEISPSVERYSKFNREELIGQHIDQLYIYPEERKKLLKAIKEKGEVIDFELKFKDKDNRVIYVSANSHFIFDSQNRIMGIEGSLRVINDRKKTEKRLQISQVQLENAMDLAHLASWEFDISTNQFLFNDRFYSMLNTTIDEEGSYIMPLNDYLKKYVHPKDVHIIKDGIKKILKSKTGFETELEYRILRKDGKTLYIAVHIRIPQKTKENNINVYGTIQDITDIKLTEKRLKESVKEKEILLKEIHHRVKNNMQIISSLLNIQTLYVDDDESINVLKESQNRVKSMAMIHEKLYGSKNFNKICFPDYIESVVWDLFYSYSIEKDTIIPLLDIDDIRLNIETSIPCGLIITELVSNCFKYAFPDNRKGELKVSLKIKQDYYVLTISDDGIGFPKNIDFNNTKTLGLELVNNLVNQIEGTIQLNTNLGTEFVIKFKELQYKERI